MNALWGNDRLSIQLHKSGITFLENLATDWKYVQRYTRPTSGTTRFPTKKINEYIYTSS
jgi:hypothetical protein